MLKQHRLPVAPIVCYIFGKGLIWKFIECGNWGRPLFPPNSNTAETECPPVAGLYAAGRISYTFVPNNDSRKGHTSRYMHAWLPAPQNLPPVRTPSQR
jgi:hypothetical protein